MEDKIQRLVNAANSTNATAKEMGTKGLRELGLDNNGNPLKSASTKEVKPKAERKKREPKAKGEPKPKYKVGDILYHTDSSSDKKLLAKIEAITGWTGEEHRYDIVFLDDKLKPKGYAKGYDSSLSQISKSKADQPYDCDDLIAKAEERKAKAKANAIKRANEPKKTQATKNVEAVDKTAERVEKNVEKRVGKGDVSVEEIDKIIAEYETALKKLRALREKASSKMAKGGGVNAEEVEHILMKAKGVKEHHCGCGSKKMATGGNVDLFEDYENIPSNVKSILDKYSDDFGGDGSDMDYNNTGDMLQDVQAVGYTFDYGLDNEPYGLRPIGVNLNELKDYEEFAKGGGVEWDKDSDGIRAELGEFRINITPQMQKGYYDVYVSANKKGIGQQYDIYGIANAKDIALEMISKSMRYAKGGGVAEYLKYPYLLQQKLHGKWKSVYSFTMTSEIDKRIAEYKEQWNDREVRVIKNPKYK
jgi:hypothetical protein